MPDPTLYFKAMTAAAIASAVTLMAIVRLRRSRSPTWLPLACVLGIGIGLISGNYQLSLNLTWPPVNGLDRLFTIVIPTVLCIELVAGIQAVPRSLAWLLRIVVAAVTPRILLHGSIYLIGTGGGEVMIERAFATLAVTAFLLAGTWWLLSTLSHRSRNFAGAAIPLSIAMSTLCAGVAVMMAGYIKGGAAAFPLTATVIATTSVVWWKWTFDDPSSPFGSPALIGIAFVGLFGLLFVGHFFGRLSTGHALTVLMAPCLCWATEFLPLRPRKPWVAGAIRLWLVAIPLFFVLALAKREFDREMRPLLGTSVVKGDSFATGWVSNEE